MGVTGKARWISIVGALLALSLGSASALAQQSDAALGDQYAAAGSFKAAGDAYLRAFEATNDPTYAKKAGNAYLQLGSAGKNDAIKAYSAYIRGARTLDEATEGEELLKKAQALPDAPAPTAPPPPPPAATPAPAQPAPAPPPAPAAPAQPAPAPTTEPVALPGTPTEGEGGGEAEPEAETAGATLARPGRLVLGASRLMGLAIYKERLVVGDAETTDSGTDIGLLIAPAAPSEITRVYRASSVPRFTLDYFVTDAISVGGFAGYASRSGETEDVQPGAPAATEDLPSSTLLMIGARGGYFHPLSDRLAFWGLGGLSYASMNVSQGDEELSVSAIYVNAEANLAFKLFGTAYVMAGGFFDGTLSGSAERTQGGTSSSEDVSYGEVTFGATTSLVVGF